MEKNMEITIQGTRAFNMETIMPALQGPIMGTTIKIKLFLLARGKYFQSLY